jgi:hypothetical protein
MNVEHSLSCSYPEGCSCGATRVNQLEADLDRLGKQLAEARKAAVIWSSGPIPKYIAEEGFLAKVKTGASVDRVVLSALPKEYSYDYTTLDSTFYKAETIVEWAQFPDSEYTSMDDQLAEARKALTEILAICYEELDDNIIAIASAARAAIDAAKSTNISQSHK